MEKLGEVKTEKGKMYSVYLGQPEKQGIPVWASPKGKTPKEGQVIDVIPIGTSKEEILLSAKELIPKYYFE